MTKKFLTITLIMTAALHVLTACGGTPAEEDPAASEASAVPEVSQADLISTEAANLANQYAAETAAAMPSATPLPTLEPTQAPTLEPTPTFSAPENTSPTQPIVQLPTNTLVPQLPTKPPASSKSCLGATLEWELWADYSEINQSSKFTKKWRIKNIGSCTWNSSYSIVFVDGDLMSAGSRHQLTETDVPPGGYVTIEIEMTAPYTPGTYRSDWRLVASDGTIFGISPGNGTLWTIIKSIDVTEE